MNLKRCLFLFFVILSAFSLLFADDFDDEISKIYTEPSTANEDPEDFDDLFNESEDVVVEEQEKAPKPQDTSKPITFTGYLSSDVGLGFSSSNTNSFAPATVFKMENYIYLTARANENLDIRANLLTSFPAERTTKISQIAQTQPTVTDFNRTQQLQNFSLSYEIYFEYLLLNRVFLQAGKRKITWGNINLRSNNIMEDAKNALSISISVPVWKINFTGIILYQTVWGISDVVIQDLSKDISIPVPSVDSLSFAGSIEGVFGPFQINIFGRRWAKNDPNRKRPALGLEAKLSIKGYDLYNQTIFYSQFSTNSKTSAIEYGLLDSVTCKTGFMKDWEEPRIGFNIEYHYTYYNKTVYPKKNDAHEIFFKGLVSRLFNNTSKFGLEFNINILELRGTITPGYVFYKIANSELKVAIPISFSTKSWSLIPVCYLEFDWHY